MSRWFAFYVAPVNTVVMPPPLSLESDFMTLSNGGQLALVRFNGPVDGQAWVASVQGVTFLPRRQRPLGAAAVAVLAPFGVVTGDTVDSALEKIYAAWPHPGLWDHY